MRVIGHTSYLGHTGYNNHSRNFFRELSKLTEVHIRNYSHVDDMSYLTPKELSLLDSYDSAPGDINLVLNESHHHFFYDEYTSPKIAYNVWESTKQLPEYFNKILEYDQFWCPTECQRQWTIDQGYPADRVKVVPEGVNGKLFRPSDDKSILKKYGIPEDTFTFMIFGRWDYRKSVAEMIRSFNEEFKDIENVMLIISVDNPFAVDGMKTTEERLKHHGLESDKIKILHFPPREDYVKLMQAGNVFLSCSRSEGWNLPLMEAIACGTPSICSGWGPQLEFADGISHIVDTVELKAPEQVFMLGDSHDLGVWSEPDFNQLKYVMRKRKISNEYDKSRAVKLSKYIRELYTWENAARIAKSHLDKLTKKYTPVGDMELYQDQYVNGSIIVEGKRDCDSRYKSIKPVFNKFNRPFTILDIGANFGYYSIRAATEYNSTSVMIENKDDETKKLIELCDKNDCRSKLTVLQTSMDLHKLKELSKCEHFDVVLALNVIHHFENEDMTELCKVFTELGDNLILETPPVEDEGACGQDRLQPIYDYFKDRESIKLGEFERHTSNVKSDILWFKTPKTELKWPYFDYEKLFDDKRLDVETLKNRGSNTIDSNFDNKIIYSPRREEVRTWIPGINLKTFLKLNGVYPFTKRIIDKLKTKDIQGDYKWDNSNNDLVTHNFILNGHDLHIIDYDDELIKETTFDDEVQLKRIINEVMNAYNIVPEFKKIKINLGCGNDIMSGYVNIDRYNNTGNVDINADLGDLPFKNDSVSEIYTYHVFEHIGLNDMYSVLDEWKRVLVVGGKLILHLPNLEAEIKIWLDASDDKKWFEVGRIFGSQSHEGNSHLCGFNPGSLKSFLERFDFEIENIGLGDSGFGEEIQCTAIKKPIKELRPTSYNCHFVDGPFAETKGDGNDKSYYQFDFLDPDSNSSVHQHVLGINSWTRPFRKFYTNWLIEIRKNGKLEFEHKFDCSRKNVLISMNSDSLGDTIAWIPYAEEFRKKHDCVVWISTFWNNLFEGAYKDLKFIKPGTTVYNLYASYTIGCYDEDLTRNKFNWRTTPLQKVSADALGLEYKEIVTDIAIKPAERPIKEKYVTISEWSTLQCKHWNYNDGWQKIVNWFNNRGYKVMVISREKTNLKNIINKTNKSIEETITNIYHSKLFLGVSAGPAWLAWALKIPVVMISGYSAEWGEFKTNCERIINKTVCNSCFNDINEPFDRGDWNYCPRNKGTNKQFECTKNITPDRVIESIERILKRR